MPEIWRWLAISAAASFISALLHPWLLAPVFLFGPANVLAIAWTEWHDPYVGPAIAQEGGTHYGFVANTAMILTVLACLCLWHLVRLFPRLSLWRLIRSLSAREELVGHLLRVRVRRDDLRFSIAILAITLFHAATGFAFRFAILGSMPVVIALAAVLVTWMRFRTLRHEAPSV